MMTASIASPATAPEGMTVGVSVEVSAGVPVGDLVSDGLAFGESDTTGEDVAMGIATPPDWSCAMTVPIGCVNLKELSQHCSVVNILASLSQHQ